MSALDDLIAGDLGQTKQTQSALDTIISRDIGVSQAGAIPMVSQSSRDANAMANTSAAVDRLKNLALGAVRGAGSIGATLLAPVDYAARQLGVSNDYIGRTDRRSAMDEALKGFGADPTSLYYKGGKLGTEIAGTAGIGSVAAGALKLTAPVLSRLGVTSPAIDAVANAIGSSGFKAGAPATNLLSTNAVINGATRMTGGGISGGLQAGMVNPDDAGVGAAIGAVLPPAIKVAAAAGSLPVKAYRAVTQPATNPITSAILNAAEVQTPEQIAQLRSALTQQGPSMIPGSAPTVPQLLQMPGVSQLQRTAKSAGNLSLGNQEIQNNAAQIAALNGISPVTGTLQQAAETFGNATQNYARSARKNATQSVRDAFDAVDPYNESALTLPIQEMKDLQSKYLGLGTFGTGSKAQMAIDTAEGVGTTIIPADKPISMKGVQDLAMAVRAAGGINTTSNSGRELSGEIKNLRESGLNNIVKPNGGKSVERMAETMHEAGFLPDNDPATLLEHLQIHAGGQKIYAAGTDDYFRAMQQSTNGLSPEQIIDKPVSFETLQNLRSSIGEASKQAEAKGADKEAAALSEMVGRIDSRVNRAAGGNVGENEFFPQDMADRYRTALGLHQEKKLRFDTGPQVNMFRMGGDGQPSAQGAELAGKFFNAGRSQVEDAQALKRLAGDNTQIPDAIRNYAITDLAGQTNKFGTLNNLNYNNWLDGRSGALRETFTAPDVSLMRQIGGQVQAADLAENLGRASGSNTVQNANNALSIGLLDHPAVNALANRIPFAKAFTGPLLDTMKVSAKAAKANQLGGLLSDPEALDSAISALLRSKTPGRISNGLGGLLDFADRSAYRVAPLLSSDQ